MYTISKKIYTTLKFYYFFKNRSTVKLITKIDIITQKVFFLQYISSSTVCWWHCTICKQSVNSVTQNGCPSASEHMGRIWETFSRNLTKLNLGIENIQTALATVDVSMLKHL